MNGKRHAVIVDGAGRFLGVNGRTWMEEYPNAAKLTPREAIKLLASAGAGTIAIAHYGESDQMNLARNPTTRTRVAAFERSCGCLRAGIMIEQGKLTVERCDDCNLFETDSDAAVAVDALVQLLGKVYEAHPEDTVADSMDRLTGAADAVSALRAAVQMAFDHFDDQIHCRKPRTPPLEYSRALRSALAKAVGK